MNYKLKNSEEAIRIGQQSTWRSLLREALEEAGNLEDVTDTGLKCFCNGCSNKAVTRRTIIDSPLVFHACLCPACAALPKREILDKL